MPEKHSFFKVFSPQRNACRIMIPRAFRVHMGWKQSGSVHLKGTNGGFWRVKLVEEDGKLYLTKRWSSFVQSHRIRADYFLFFKMVDAVTFKVKVFNAAGCEVREASHSPDVGVSRNDNRARTGEAVARRHAQAAETYPNFIITISDYSVGVKNPMRGLILVMPFWFVKAHLGHFVKPKTAVVLQWENKKWPANVTKSGSLTYISGGWKDFVKEANVKKGDACKFDLVDRFVMSLSIIIP